MTINKPDAQTLVKDLLESYPQVATVFLRHGMSCVGCDMSKFETLADAASTYGLSLPEFLQERTAVMFASSN